MKLSYTRLFVALAVLLAALLLALWLPLGPARQWRTWQSPPPQPPELQDALETLLAPNPAASAAYPEAVNRPLFSANRRPVAADPVAAPTPIDQARLLGIVDGMGVRGVMIDYDGQSRFVRQGEDVGGWRLASMQMQERTASFERGGEQRELTLPLISPLPPANTPAPAGGAPAARPPVAAAPASPFAAKPPTLAPQPVTQPASRPSAAASAAFVPTFSGSRKSKVNASQPAFNPH
jgi:hypothetical protein